ncbi:MAG: M28 family peptidase [Acidobacteria bacterium]|nr:M28 family peptidase [Acidobacteriota bacterium]
MAAAPLLAAVAAALAAWAATAVELDPARYLNDVKYLASEDLRGRGTGTPELDRAAKYIAQEFKNAGLRPLDRHGYYQKFAVSTNSTLGGNNRLAYRLKGERLELKLKKDFIPFNFSASARLSGDLVFAGYGITAREYNYDDYAGLDATGKIAVILRHEPQEFDAKSVFAGRVYTEHAQLFSKAVNAKMHGARAVLFLNDIHNHSSEDALEKFSSVVGPTNPGIPFVHVKTEAVERWFQAAGKDLKVLHEAIDRDLTPQSFAFPPGLQVEIETDVRRNSRRVSNVAAYLPGETPEYIVIGAHYDHLGLGEQFSLAPSLAGTPHPGADDNASGTAAVLALARWFAAQPKPKRGILFVTFAGEELGLLGSSYYVNHPELPLDRAVAMINMDMIGRIRDGKVVVGGVGSGTSFRRILDELKPAAPFHFDFSDNAGYGSSDHTSFTSRQVPALFFFSGLHSDYHKPSDTWDKINAPAAARLAGFIAEVASRLANEPERPQFVRVAPPKMAHATPAGQHSGAVKGYGPYFGSIPDFAEPPRGVRFADVREGSPAAQAGLKAGDILVEFDGKKIDNLYDFTYALRSKQPGEEVLVEVLRDNQPIRVKVVLAERR